MTKSVLLFSAALAFFTAGTITTASFGYQQEKKAQQSSAKDKVFEAKKLLADAKKQLAQEKKYNCCTTDPCNQCALDHQSCPCYDDLKKGKPVCPECYGGWQRGEGKDKNIKPSDVKTSYGTHKH
ncbi:MAG: hypothetical protein ACRDGA_07315 [Bacteroidota bacterium]